MALILIMLSLILGLSLGLWLVDSIPPPTYTYLTVVFLVMLDGLLYSYQHLQRGEGIWRRLAQRMSLQLAYGGFIIFFGAKAGRDLLLLAVIPLGFNVFANFVQFIPREAGEVLIIPREGPRLGRVELSVQEPTAVTMHEALPLPAEITPAIPPTVVLEAPPPPVPDPAAPATVPAITTITVATLPATALAVEEPTPSGNGVHPEAR
ncbi:MAG TPA: hypothetical protein VEI97_00790 [bacterium]|nr:hypothetical protein [bacterium]